MFEVFDAAMDERSPDLTNPEAEHPVLLVSHGGDSCTGEAARPGHRCLRKHRPAHGRRTAHRWATDSARWPHGRRAAHGEGVGCARRGRPGGPHAAGDPSRRRSRCRSSDPSRVRHPATLSRAAEKARQVNVEGTRHLLEALKAHAPEAKILFASSLDVFGRSTEPPPRRVSDPVQATDVYTGIRSPARSWSAEAASPGVSSATRTFLRWSCARRSRSCSRSL